MSSKSHTCTGSMFVNVAGISVKVTAHYPGRSAELSGDSRTTLIERREEGSAEVSRRYSRLTRPSRRPEHELSDRSLEFRW